MCKLTPVFKQFVAIFCCNLLTLSIGIVSGWATINFNELQNENSTYTTGPLTLEQSSMVVAIENIGGFIGNFAILPLIPFVGVKRLIHLLGLPMIVSSILIIWAQNVYFLYGSRMLSGLASGALVIAISTLINDISNNNIRGALNAISNPLYNSGLIISFFLGNIMNCADQGKIQLIVPVIFLFSMFFFPESPEFWANKNKDKQAKKSRRFYVGSIAALEAVDFIPKSKNDQEKGDSSNADDKTEENSKLAFKDFFTKHARRAFFISFTSLALCFLSGSSMLIRYVTDVFTKTGSSMSPKNSSVLISITQIVTDFMVLNVIEHINRRTLYIWSSLLTTISFIVFGTHCLLWIDRPEMNWMPPFCLTCIIYFSRMGLVPIPYILTTELFPKKIRQVCLALVVSIMWTILFILELIFPIFLEEFGLFICMIGLGSMCFLNLIFGILCIPETRGKSFDEIAEILNR